MKTQNQAKVASMIQDGCVVLCDQDKKERRQGVPLSDTSRARELRGMGAINNQAEKEIRNAFMNPVYQDLSKLHFAQGC